MQKIRLVLRGWNRRREERDREFLAKNAAWTPASAGAGGLKPASTQKQVDMDGLTVACLDGSGQLAHYLDIETGDVIDTREAISGDRYRRIPSQSESADREVFLAALDDSGARARLKSGDFRNELARDRKLERAWYNFRNDRAIAAIEQWLGETRASRALS